MRSVHAAIRIGVLVVALSTFGASAAYAHDCASQADCEQTTGYISGIATIGGIIAILTGILGGQIGGGVGGAVGGAAGAGTGPGPGSGGEGVAVAEPPPGEEPGPAPTPADAAKPPEAAAAPPEGEGEEPEIPWDDLIAATEPPGEAGEETPIEELLEEPEEEPIEDLIDELLGPEPTDAGAETAPEPTEEGVETGEETEAEPLEEEEEGEPDEEEEEGEPGEEEETPPVEDKPPDTTTPKPPGLETAETIGGIAGNVKDGVDKVKEELEDLPIDDATKKEITDKLDEIGEKAEQIKGGAEKAAEYINALDENLQRTDKLGITEDSQNFLGWWRVTFKAAGELTQKFVDGVFAPVKKLLGDRYGDKAEELLHDAVPIKEFGEELSKLPTSAAENVVNASQRGQIGENAGLVPKGDAGYIELDDLFPGRKWP